MSERRVEVDMPKGEAWRRVISAAEQVGKVESRADGAYYLTMKARYGLNPVRLRVSVLTGPNEGASVIEIQGRGQDVWGVASRTVIDRLCAAL